MRASYRAIILGSNGVVHIYTLTLMYSGKFFAIRTMESPCEFKEFWMKDVFSAMIMAQIVYCRYERELLRTDSLLDGRPYLLVNMYSATGEHRSLDDHSLVTGQQRFSNLLHSKARCRGSNNC